MDSYGCWSGFFVWLLHIWDFSVIQQKVNVYSLLLLISVFELQSLVLILVPSNTLPSYQRPGPKSLLPLCIRCNPHFASFPCQWKLIILWILMQGRLNISTMGTAAWPLIKKLEQQEISGCWIKCKCQVLCKKIPSCFPSKYLDTLSHRFHTNPKNLCWHIWITPWRIFECPLTEGAFELSFCRVWVQQPNSFTTLSSICEF